MFKLLKKEMGLTAHIISYIFIAFALMTFIPNYPILIGAFFICYGIFQSFQWARESNDIIYSSMLPVEKKDIVTAKFAFTAAIQMISYFLCLAFTLIKLLVLKDFMPYEENPLMNANLAYLGYVLIVFACFNTFFLCGFFKTAFKIGIPFIIFAVGATVTLGIGEALHYIVPELNTPYHYSQIIVLAAGAVIYAGGTALSWFVSQKRFLKIDL